LATIWKVDGFEHGVAAAGSSGVYDSLVGSITIGTSPTRGALRSARVNAVAAAAHAGYNLPAATRQVVVGIAVCFSTADGFSGTSQTIFSFSNANGNGQLRYHGATGRLGLAHNTAGNVDIGPVLVADTWYWVDLLYDCSSGVVSLSGRVDGGAVDSSTRTQTAADCTAVSIGTFAADTVSVHFDDWVTSITAADFPLRQHHIQSLIPSSDGTHNIAVAGDFDSNTTTAFSNATTNGFSFIGHRPMQNADIANQVIREELGSATDYMEFNLENLGSSTGTPVAVRTYVDAIEAGTGNQNAEARLLLSTNVEVLTEGSLSVLDTTESVAITVTTRSRMALDPAGGWDNTKVNGLKARLGFGDSTPDLNWIDFMVEVALFDPIDATPAVVVAQVTVPTPTIGLGATAAPDAVSALTTIPAPAIHADAVATPSAVAAQATIPAPTISAGGGAVAQPVVVAAVVSIPTPTIGTDEPDSDHYNEGYGGGYERPVVVVEPPIVPVLPNIPTPNLRVQVDWVHDINQPGAMVEPSWTDITALLRQPEGFSISRGRQRELDKNEAGTASMMFDDFDRILDPGNLDGPYYPGVTPTRRIRIQAVTPWETGAFTMNQSYVGGDDLVGGGETFHYTTIFDGVIDSYDEQYPDFGFDAKIGVRASDMLAIFAKDSIFYLMPGGYAPDALNYTLNQRSYTGRTEEGVTNPYAGSDLRDIPPVTAVNSGSQIALSSLNYNGTPLLTPLQDITISAGGNFFIARDGKPTWREPDWPLRPGDQRLRFASDAELFANLEFTYDESLIYNNITVTNDEINISATVTDQASITRHFTKDLEVATIIASQANLDRRANELLVNYHLPHKVITKLDLSDVVDDWDLILSCDLWDRVTVEVRLPNGDIVTQQSVIEGIEISSGSRPRWSVIWWLSLIPFVNLLDYENYGFEGAFSPFTGSIGDWTAETNCVLTAESEKVIWKRSGHFDRSRTTPGTALIYPPQGSYALRAEALTGGLTTSVTKNPVTAVTDASNGGGTAWTNPGNALASDNVYATVDVIAFPAPNSASHYLKTTNYGLGVPTDAVILGIQVGIEMSTVPGGGVKERDLRLYKNGVGYVGTNKMLGGAQRDPVSSPESVRPYGSSGDLWGTTWTPAEVNSPGFGVGVAFQSDGFATRHVQVDTVTITVFYSLVFTTGFSYLSPMIPVIGRATYLGQTKQQVALTNLDINYNEAATHPVHLEIDWFDASSVYLSTDVGETVTVDGAGSGGGLGSVAGWTLLGVEARAPNGAAFAQLRVAATGLLLYQGQYTDDVLFTRID
jgi:hypothetical protein